MRSHDEEPLLMAGLTPLVVHMRGSAKAGTGSKGPPLEAPCPWPCVECSTVRVRALHIYAHAT